jgi:hypothetical protein
VAAIPERAGYDGRTRAGDPATDKLAQVVTRGTLTLSTDLRYPRQSFAVKRAKRAPASRNPANQLTAPQVTGLDGRS